MSKNKSSGERPEIQLPFKTSMPHRVIACPHCGAPLPKDAWWRKTVTCAFCKAAVIQVTERVNGRDFLEARRRLQQTDVPLALGLRCAAAGQTYQLKHCIAEGESGRVFFASRTSRLGERVLIKVLRDSADADFFQRESEALNAIQKFSAQNGIPFASWLPALQFSGEAQFDNGKQRIQLYRYPSGFAHTLADIVTLCPGGIDVKHGVWIWKRILDALHLVHQSGLGHGAVLPQHVAIHARDHGAKLLGFACCAPLERVLPAIDERHRSHYPRFSTPLRLTRTLDLVMAARTVRLVLKGAIVDAETIPLDSGFLALLNQCCEPTGLPTDEAWALKKLVSAAAEQSYGAPHFLSLNLPL